MFQTISASNIPFVCSRLQVTDSSRWGAKTTLAHQNITGLFFGVRQKMTGEKRTPPVRIEIEQAVEILLPF